MNELRLSGSVPIVYDYELTKPMMTLPGWRIALYSIKSCKFLSETNSFPIFKFQFINSKPDENLKKKFECVVCVFNVKSGVWQGRVMLGIWLSPGSANPYISPDMQHFISPLE